MVENKAAEVEQELSNHAAETAKKAKKSKSKNDKFLSKKPQKIGLKVII